LLNREVIFAFFATLKENPYSEIKEAINTTILEVN